MKSAKQNIREHFIGVAKEAKEKKQTGLISIEKAKKMFAEFLKTIDMPEDQKLEVYRVFRATIGQKTANQKEREKQSGVKH